MTRREMLERMESQELSGWYALFSVRREEAEYQRHVMESGDGQVIVHGRDDDDDDDDE